jgi:hypothetical protein
MIIVRLLSPEPVGWIQHHQLYSSVGADIVMESITLIEGRPVVNERYGLISSATRYNRQSAIAELDLTKRKQANRG